MKLQWSTWQASLPCMDAICTWGNPAGDANYAKHVRTALLLHITPRTFSLLSIVFESKYHLNICQVLKLKRTKTPFCLDMNAGWTIECIDFWSLLKYVKVNVQLSDWNEHENAARFKEVLNPKLLWTSMDRKSRDFDLEILRCCSLCRASEALHVLGTQSAPVGASHSGAITLRPAVDFCLLKIEGWWKWVSKRKATARGDVELEKWKHC